MALHGFSSIRRSWLRLKVLRQLPVENDQWWKILSHCRLSKGTQHTAWRGDRCAISCFLWESRRALDTTKLVTTPLWGKCEVATHTPENGTWESSKTLENVERDCKGQNTSHWSVLCTVEKVLKCRCLKWPRMSHLDICSISYGRKKGQELNCQFDSRPLKVKNRLDSGACRRSVTHRWKALEDSYNFGWDLVPIRPWGKKLWMPKVPGVQTGIVSRLHFGSPGKKSHLDARATKSCREYYMGEGGGFPWVRAVVSQVSPRLPVACLNTKNVQNEF